MLADMKTFFFYEEEIRSSSCGTCRPTGDFSFWKIVTYADFAPADLLDPFCFSPCWLIKKKNTITTKKEDWKTNLFKSHYVCTRAEREHALTHSIVYRLFHEAEQRSNRSEFSIQKTSLWVCGPQCDWKSHSQLKVSSTCEVHAVQKDYLNIFPMNPNLR